MKLSKYMSHVFVLKRNHMPRDIHICLFLYPKAAQYVRWTLQCHEPMPRQHPKTNSLHQTPLEFAPYICFILGNQLHTKNKPDQEWIYIYIHICIYHIHIRLYTLNTSNIYLDTRPIRVKYRRSRVQKTCPKNNDQASDSALTIAMSGPIYPPSTNASNKSKTSCTRIFEWPGHELLSDVSPFFTSQISSCCCVRLQPQR